VKLLQGRVVLVSGGTQGIGAGVARAAVREGASVVVTGRRPESGEPLARELGGTYLQSDVSDVDSARASARLDTTPELFDQHIAVNLRGPVFLMQAAVQDMVRRGEPGTIVNIISSSELGGQPYLAPYVAAKAGLAGLTRNAAHAHRFDRIRINGLDIGWTDTEGEDITQRAFHAADDGWRERAAKNLPMGKLGQVDEIADFVVFLLSTRSGVVTGSVIDWDQNVLGGMD
jgi:NAD(P)-dependent dehydrogenase (short-subunit alcohol dehydrogenase family)